MGSIVPVTSLAEAGAKTLETTAVDEGRPEAEAVWVDLLVATTIGCSRES